MLKYIPHTVASVASLALLFSGASVGPQAHEPLQPSLQHNQVVQDTRESEVREARASLEAAREKVKELLTPTVSTDAVVASENKLRAAFELAGEPLPGEVLAFSGGLSLDANHAPELAEERKAELQKLSEELTALRESEAARLAAEEAARKQAEEAARQEAAAAATAAQPSAPRSPRAQNQPQGAGDTAAPAPKQGKLSGAVASLGFVSIPVVESSGTCPSRSYGCYVPGGGTIYITPLGMGQSHCGLRKTVAHEYKHYLQEREGWLRNGEGMTLDEIEAEAYAFGAQYGC